MPVVATAVPVVDVDIVVAVLFALATELVVVVDGVAVPVADVDIGVVVVFALATELAVVVD